MGDAYEAMNLGGKAYSGRLVGRESGALARAVICQRLFVEKVGLPSPLLNQIKRLAAFQNPDFYKKQSMRLSTALTPRIISCAEECADHVALPRGCLPELEALLQAHGVSLELEDKRTEGESVGFAFQGKLTANGALTSRDTSLTVARGGEQDRGST